MNLYQEFMPKYTHHVFQCQKSQTKVICILKKVMGRVNVLEPARIPFWIDRKMDKDDILGQGDWLTLKGRNGGCPYSSKKKRKCGYSSMQLSTKDQKSRSNLLPKWPESGHKTGVKPQHPIPGMTPFL
ncbi:uncharacterized protein LOC144870088 isoform X2 [Branchiostoma floridae x Branchiostoma japonicum]